MSLALLGLLTIVSVLAAIMSRRVTPLVALIVVPVAGGARSAGSASRPAPFAVAGIQETAPVAAMFVFAILFFGVMTDAGLLDPIVAGVLRAVGLHPTRIVVGSALLALVVHLDGSGAVTFLVTVPAMLPLYDRLGHGSARARLRRVARRGRELPAVDGTGAARLRGAADPDRDAVRAADPGAGGRARVRVHGGLVRWAGAKSRRLAASLDAAAAAAVAAPRELTAAERALRRPGRFPINLLLTLVAMGTMLSGRARSGDRLHARRPPSRCWSTIPTRRRSGSGSTRTRGRR